MISALAAEGAERKPLTTGEKWLAALCVLVPGVIGVVGILAAVILATLSASITKGHTALSAAQIKSLGVSLELYYATHGNKYPATLEELSSDLSDSLTTRLGDFTYTSTDTTHQTFTLCTKNPVPAGSDTCIHSPESTSSPQK
jgi:type II secretory pathway pseudopilin PulG